VTVVSEREAELFPYYRRLTMSKWKAALLAATSSLSALLLGGCLGLGGLNWDQVIRLATIGNIFD
jgi:purine-cytosine permease-like protein